MDVGEAANEVRSFMLRLSERIAGHFPHHSLALRGEILGERLTNERWNRITAILASCSSVPGVALGPAEHMSRGLAVRSVVVAQKMAAARLGLYKDDPGELADFAVWLLREISQDMGEQPQAQG